MKLKLKIAFIFVFLLVFNLSNAGTLIVVKGNVTKIEKGFAYIESSSGTSKILMKKLTTSQTKVIQTAQGSKKEIALKVLPIAIQQD